MNKMIKNLVSVAIVSIALSTMVLAQSKNEERKVSGFINLGGGLGTPYVKEPYLKSQLPINPSITIERPASSPSVNPNGTDGLNEIWQLVSDRITIGGNVAYGLRKFKYANVDYKFNLLYINARSSLHVLKGRKFDPYLGASFGYVAVFSTLEDYGTTAGIANGFGYSYFGGVRYLITKNFGCFAEIGNSPLAVATFGLTFNK